MSALVVRPIGPDEVELFTSFADASPLGLKPPLAMYLDGLHQWYRPEWSWVALRDGQVVARVAFSGPPEAELPLVMGSLEIGTRPDRVETGVALVRTAYAAMTGGGTGEGGRPEYRQFLPVDWHEHAGMRAAVADRRTVARLAGLRFLVERVELRWPAESGAALPPRPGRLTFRPVGDDAEVLAVVRGTLEGTLGSRCRACGRGEPTSPMSACSRSTEATATPTSCCWRPATYSSRAGLPRSWPPPMWATHRWRRRSRAAGTWWSTG